jgi:hypothetical protein
MVNANHDHSNAVGGGSLGIVSATSINKVTITVPTTSAIITIADGKTFTCSNTITLSGTDSASLAIGTGGTLGTAAYTAATAYATSSQGTKADTALQTNSALGTPASGVLTNCTNYPTDISVDVTPQLGGDLDLNGHQITGHREDHWTKTTGTFTATPASTSTLTMTSDLTASILVGMPLKYVIGGTTYYGRVSAIASDLLTVNGAPLSGDVTALYYGGGTVRQVVVIIPGTYEDANNTALIASDLKSQLAWNLPKSYLVKYSVFSNTHDTGTHGQASARINDTEVNTTAGGLTVAADATWYHTVVDIATAAYDVNPGEVVEVTAVKAGNGDASDLTAIMIFVTP